jgi:hypothetical protein
LAGVAEGKKGKGRRGRKGGERGERGGGGGKRDGSVKEGGICQRKKERLERLPDIWMLIGVEVDRSSSIASSSFVS